MSLRETTIGEVIDFVTFKHDPGTRAVLLAAPVGIVVGSLVAAAMTSAIYPPTSASGQLHALRVTAADLDKFRTPQPTQLAGSEYNVVMAKGPDGTQFLVASPKEPTGKNKTLLDCPAHP